MNDRRADMSRAVRQERDAEQMHQKLQGLESDEPQSPVERERHEAIDRASEDVERTLDHLDERTEKE